MAYFQERRGMIIQGIPIDFPQFRKLPIDIQLLVFEQAAIVAAEDLPGMYGFNCEPYKSDNDSPSEEENSVALFKPNPHIARAGESLRILMRTCKTARKAAINITGGCLEVFYENKQGYANQQRHTFMPFDFEHATFGVDIARLPYTRSVLLGPVQVQSCVYGMDFAPRVKNLMVVVGALSVGCPKQRADLCKFVARFANITSCILINGDAWIKGDDFYKNSAAFQRGVYKLRSSGHAVDIQSTIRPNGARVTKLASYPTGKDARTPNLKSQDSRPGMVASSIEQATAELAALEQETRGWQTWLSARVRLQSTNEEDDPSATDSSKVSCEFLLTKE